MKDIAKSRHMAAFCIQRCLDLRLAIQALRLRIYRQRRHHCGQRHRVNRARDPHPSPGRELNLDRTAGPGGRRQRLPADGVARESEGRSWLPLLRPVRQDQQISREDILAHAYAQCRSNKGAPGVDGQDFADVEAYGVQRWLGELALALRHPPRSEPSRQWSTAVARSGPDKTVTVVTFAHLLAS
jgi:hypothetical protein